MTPTVPPDKSELDETGDPLEGATAVLEGILEGLIKGEDGEDDQREGRGRTALQWPVQHKADDLIAAVEADLGTESNPFQEHIDGLATSSSVDTDPFYPKMPDQAGDDYGDENGEEPTSIRPALAGDPSAPGEAADLSSAIGALEQKVANHVEKYDMLIAGAGYEIEKEYNEGRAPLAHENVQLSTKLQELFGRMTRETPAADRTKLAEIEIALGAVKPNPDFVATAPTPPPTTLKARASMPEESAREEAELQRQIAKLEEELSGVVRTVEEIDESLPELVQLLAIDGALATVTTVLRASGDLLPQVQQNAPACLERLSELVRNLGSAKMNLEQARNTLATAQYELLIKNTDDFSGRWQSLKIGTEKLLELDGKTVADLQAQQASLQRLGEEVRFILPKITLLSGKITLEQAVNLIGVNESLEKIAKEIETLSGKLQTEIERPAAEAAAPAPSNLLTVDGVNVSTGKFSAVWELIKQNTERLLQSPSRTITALEEQRDVLRGLKENHLDKLVFDIDRLLDEAPYPKAVLIIANNFLEDVSGKLDTLLQRLEKEIGKLRVALVGAATSDAVPATPSIEPAPVPLGELGRHPTEDLSTSVPAAQPAPVSASLPAEPVPEITTNTDQLFEKWAQGGEAGNLSTGEVRNFQANEERARRYISGRIVVIAGASVALLGLLSAYLLNKSWEPKDTDSAKRRGGHSDTVTPEKDKTAVALPKAPATPQAQQKPAQKAELPVPVQPAPVPVAPAPIAPAVPVAPSVPEAPAPQEIYAVDCIQSGTRNAVVCGLSVPGMTAEQVIQLGIRTKIKWVPLQPPKPAAEGWLTAVTAKGDQFGTNEVARLEHIRTDREPVENRSRKGKPFVLRPTAQQAR